jgi:hypothetical protein
MPTLERSTEMTLGNRTIQAGDEVRVTGERGRFRFLSYVTTSAGTEWVDLYGPAGDRPKMRSVFVSELRLVP